MSMSRSELVEALKAMKWDSPVEVQIRTMETQVIPWPKDLLATDGKAVELISGTRKLATLDYFAEFKAEIEQDLELLKRPKWVELGITKYAVYFHSVPYMMPNLVRYAKATNGKPRT